MSGTGGHGFEELLEEAAGDDEELAIESDDHAPIELASANPAVVAAWSAQGRFICARCWRQQRATGTCPGHPDEPLLDLEDEAARLYLDEQDAKRRRFRSLLCGLIAAAIVLPPGVFAIFGLRAWFPEFERGILRGGIVVLLGLGGLVHGVVLGRWPARTLALSLASRVA